MFLPDLSIELYLVCIAELFTGWFFDWLLNSLQGDLFVLQSNLFVAELSTE